MIIAICLCISGWPWFLFLFPSQLHLIALTMSCSRSTTFDSIFSINVDNLRIQASNSCSSNLHLCKVSMSWNERKLSTDNISCESTLIRIERHTSRPRSLPDWKFPDSSNLVAPSSRRPDNSLCLSCFEYRKYNVRYIWWAKKVGRHKIIEIIQKIGKSVVGF